MKKTFLTVCAGIMVLSLAAAPLPVAHWKLDEGEGVVIKDSGSLKLDGKVLFAANTQWGEGRNGGKALYFKGESAKGKHDGGCVRIPNVTQLGLDKPFTISCWFKPAGLDKMPRPAIYEILSNTKSDRGPGFRISLCWNEILYSCGDGKKVNFSITGKESAFPVAREAWHHVAVTVDSKRATLYLDGVKVGEKEGKNLPGQNFFIIGSYNSGYAYSFVGAISDVKFYQQALTIAEVMAEAKGMELEE